MLFSDHYNTLTGAKTVEEIDNIVLVAKHAKSRILLKYDPDYIPTEEIKQFVAEKINSLMEHAEYMRELLGRTSFPITEKKASSGQNELAECIQEKIEGLDIAPGNEKAFEEFFLAQKDYQFCINLLKELGISNSQGEYALSLKKRSSILGYIHALKGYGFITYATEPEIMKAAFSYLNTHYSRLKPESETYHRYYRLTDSKLKTYRK